MNVQKQIAKLESLLSRIQRNRETTRLVPLAVAAGSIVADEPPHSALPPTARVDTGTWPTPVPAAPAARLAEPAAAAPPELEEIDMMDAEIVELGAETAATGAAEPPSLEADLDAMGDEPAPESAPRPAAQTRAGDVDLEPPVKTPPPESGRQIMAPMAVPAPSVVFRDEPEEADLGGSDVDDLLEPDLSGGPISKAPPGMPTMEQLGETVELEGADAPAARLELVSLETTPEEAPLDDLELALPKQEFSGGYDAELAPPPGAAADLQRHQTDADRRAHPSVPPPVSLASPASMPVSARADGPVIVERPPVDTLHVADIHVAKPAKLPETFLELLDASLAIKPTH